MGRGAERASVKFFGQFLLDRGVVSREQLLDALLLQGERNQPLGAYAVQKGYITHADAERVNLAQRSMDAPFGDVAMELRLMTGDEVEELLQLQRRAHLRLGEALLHQGALDETRLTTEVEAFRADQAAFQTGIIEFPPGIPDADLLSIPVDLTSKLLLRVAGIRTKLDSAELLSDLPSADLVTASVSFSGAINTEYVLSVSYDIATTIAERMTGKSHRRQEAVKELCHVVCGSATGKLAHAGKRVDITPALAGAPMLREGDKGVCIHMPPAEGTIELRMGTDLTF